MTETFPAFVAGQPAIATPTGNELVPVVSGGVTSSVQLSKLLPNVAGVTVAPAGQVTAPAHVVIPAGAIWDYFNSPYAGVNSASVNDGVLLNAGSVLHGGNWASGGQTVTIDGNTTLVLFANIAANQISGTFSNNGVYFPAATSDSKVIGNTIVSQSYGILSNLTSGSGLTDLILALNNVDAITYGDAIEINSPGVLQSNIAILGNICSAPEFGVGVAAAHNVAIIGNVIKSVRGASGSYGAIHTEDVQHSISIVGNVGHQISGYGISVQQDTQSPHFAEGVVSVGNNLKAATSQFTGSISGTTLTVSAVNNSAPGWDTWIQSYAYLQGAGITAGTYYITGQLTGTPGGVGTYGLSASPGTISSETMYAVNDSSGFMAVYNGNGSLPGCVVVGNRFQGFGNGLTGGASDMIADGNMLDGQPGTTSAAIYQAYIGNIWGQNMASNYPTLLDGTTEVIQFCGKIISTTSPTKLIGSACGSLLKGFAFPFNPTLVNGENALPLFPTPGSGWGRLTIAFISFTGGTAVLKYSATVYWNGSIMTVESDVVSALTNHSGVSLSTSGGNVVLNTNYGLTGGPAFGELDFEGWISN